MKFSERYGYVKPVEVLKRGLLDSEGMTGICNCYDYLEKWLYEYDVYTNDSNTGIRHALMDGKELPGFEEAKYMLVSCSAFVNYIQGKRSLQ